MENAFHFTSKDLFVLKIFKFALQLFGHVTKRLDKRAKVDLKITDVRTWLTNIWNTHIAQYLTGNKTMKLGQLIEYNKRNIFQLCRKWGREISLTPLYII